MTAPTQVFRNSTSNLFNLWCQQTHMRTHSISLYLALSHILSLAHTLIQSLPLPFQVKGPAAVSSVHPVSNRTDSSSSIPLIQNAKSSSPPELLWRPLGEAESYYLDGVLINAEKLRKLQSPSTKKKRHLSHEQRRQQEQNKREPQLTGSGYEWFNPLWMVGTS